MLSRAADGLTGYELVDLQIVKRVIREMNLQQLLETTWQALGSSETLDDIVYLAPWRQAIGLLNDVLDSLGAAKLSVDGFHSDEDLSLADQALNTLDSSNRSRLEAVLCVALQCWRPGTAIRILDQERSTLTLEVRRQLERQAFRAIYASWRGDSDDGES